MQHKQQQTQRQGLEHIHQDSSQRQQLLLQ